ncbi:DUF438 domain-containing protein [Anaerococcus degeneri]|uniref:DUF438 domain-containing protein n=1 Tax=Anaerococcus degeneri TaxID=361500 RepID=A0ABS7YX44_9FIRM|nr:DUF438 domain-containing protein [Anaerococcus degeneri]MBP2015415.1 DUF438 domain-containing protein [Anaerococcus degeneri]MCA2096309.1 DUF438 domain-containing protein [Anaerococcus degeneri]
MIIDINKTVYELIKDNDKLKDDLISVGFTALNNPLMVKSLGKSVSIKRGAKMMGIKDYEIKLKAMGYELVDSSENPEVLERKKLIKSYLQRLSSGEDLESVREDFKKSFEGVSSSEIMDAEEELLGAGMDKAEVRKLCDVHSALFHGETESEKNPSTYEEGSFLDYFAKENDKIKEILENVKKSLENDQDLGEDIYKVFNHYRKKGDLIYPILKAKYNKPGPSDVMWAVDIDIANNFKKAIKLNKKDLALETIKRAEEMTYKEENILYPLAFETISHEDFDLLFKDLGDYDHDLVSYKKAENKKINEYTDGYINFAKGKMRVDQLEAMLDTLEIEITYVDENDINAYYNDHKGKKAFKRPETSLGREVYSCHPPQVEPIVRGLIKEFKAGSKDSLKLVRNIKGRDFAISYYAVRDKDGVYKGVVETVQDLSFYKEYLNK